MLRFLLLSLVFVGSLWATTLSGLTQSAAPLLAHGEFGNENLYTIMEGTNLRTSPEIKRGNEKGKGDGQKHLILKCEGEWCQIHVSGLWVHASRIAR